MTEIREGLHPLNMRRLVVRAEDGGGSSHFERPGKVSPKVEQGGKFDEGVVRSVPQPAFARRSPKARRSRTATLVMPTELPTAGALPGVWARRRRWASWIEA